MTVTSSTSGKTPASAGPPGSGRSPGSGGRPAPEGPGTAARPGRRAEADDPVGGLDGVGPPETARERVNRRWAEILQETRVAQTGVQILFGFLLSIAFTARFGTLSAFDRALYVVTVVLAASSTAALIAPVSIHRCLCGLRMKREVVEAAGRMMTCGIVLLALTIACTLLFLLHAVLPSPLAQVIVGAVMVWFALCWYVLPFRLRRRAGRQAP
ncbi:DUF6328 family protein [Streptomyces sp. NPDC012637]|uniref:DUF6328 family protein n=1 Tax=Streptomyces sp. NPDC012637 TaxID=3364842 RepID=UPI0036E0C49B